MANDIFTHGEGIKCPECKGRTYLEVAVRNYSGCSVDMGTCPECGKSWQISFKIDKMIRIPDWDAPSREEWEKEKAGAARGCGHLTQLASQASTEKGSDYEL